MITDFIIINGWSLFFLFILTFLASFAIPSAPALFIVSLAALSQTRDELYTIIIITWIATIIGDTLVFLLSQKFKIKVLRFIKKYSVLENQYLQSTKLFEKYGVMSIFVSKFIFLALGPILNYFSGLQNIKLKDFLKPMIFGELIYSISMPLIGVMFRNTWSDILSLFNNASFILLFGIIGFYSLNKIIK